MKPKITYLQECFLLRDDGSLIWRTRPNNHFSSVARAKATNKQRSGCVAGILGKDNYILVRVGGVLLPAHLIVFAMTTGRWPSAEIDHKDRNRTNNAPGNLREATRAQNMSNMPAHKDSKTGVKGVNEHIPGVFRARIRVDGEVLHLGVFRDIHLAESAYRAAEEKHRKEFAS